VTQTRTPSQTSTLSPQETIVPDMAGAPTRSSSSAPGSITDITNRMERLPFSSWQVKARVLIGTATFFDAFDALAIAQVLPVLTPCGASAPHKSVP